MSHARDDRHGVEEDFFEHAAIPLHAVGPDGTILRANRAELDLLGYAADEYVGRNIAAFHVDASTIADILRRLSAGETLRSYPARLRCRDGSIRDVLIDSNVRREQGRFVHTRCLTRDVTDLRKAEEEARDAERRLAAVVASADDAIVTKSVAGIITSWNHAAERMFGYSAAEAVGRSIALIVPPDRRDEHTGILTRVMRGEGVDHFETERVGKDGRPVPISLTISPIKDGHGRIVGISKIARDITERRRAGTETARTVRTLETLYHLADGVGRAKALADVCDAAIDAIMDVGADRASVLVFDETGVMRFRAWRHLSDRYRAAVDGHSPWTPEATDPAPLVVEDVLTDPSMRPLRDVIAGEGIRSLAFVPLVAHGRLLGKFMIYYDVPHAFSASELRLAATIAHHVAFGVARVQVDSSIEALLTRERIARQEADEARLEAEHRRTVAEELARVAHTVTESLDVAAVAERVVQSALGLFRARGAGLRLCDADGSLVGIAFAGGMREAFAPGHRIAAGPFSVSGLAIVQGVAVWSDDTLTDPRLQLAEDLRNGMTVAGDGAVLAVPLRAKGRIFGALSIADRAGRRFTPVATTTLQAFADQAALAIENARLYEEARRQQREAELVAELAQRMNASLDLGTTLARLVEGACDLIAGDIARIVVRDPASGRMRLRHRIGTRWTGYDDDTVVEAGKGSGGVVLTTGKPFRTDDYVNDPRISEDFKAMALADGTVAQVVVPIPGESGIGGLLYVDRREPRPFTEEDEAVLLRLADHAGIAIRNSHLFAAEQAARADADATNAGKDRFLAVLSHELRTPLTAILGWARFLKVGRFDQARQARAIDVIARNAHLQAQLLADMLDIARIAAGKMQIDRMPVDLVAVVREAIDGLAADVDAKGLRLVPELDESVGAVFGDARRLQQVTSNLVSNAVKFTPAGGQITIRLARHEANARLIVADTGEGIDPGLLPRIFDPFEQGDGSSTRLHQGLGLGLAIVRQLVELHGGTIRADSAGRGAGATFTVDLPVVALGRAAHAAIGECGPGDVRPGDRLRGRSVLVVDDQPDARELLAFVLERSGADVHTAESANEALRILDEHADIDALVSDIAMPETDGYGLIEIVRTREREHRRSILAIAVTANAGLAARQRALGAGFDAHATKPVDPDELVELIANLLT